MFGVAGLEHAADELHRSPRDPHDLFALFAHLLRRNTQHHRARRPLIDKRPPIAPLGHGGCVVHVVTLCFDHVLLPRSALILSGLKVLTAFETMKRWYWHKSFQK